MYLSPIENGFLVTVTSTTKDVFSFGLKTNESDTAKVAKTAKDILISTIKDLEVHA